MESSSRIFVKGLPPSLTIEEFRKHFSKQSPITDAKFIPHRRIGYVGFRTPEDAARAVNYHNRSFIRMSKIGVELARSVDEQQQALRSHRNGANVSKMGMTHSGREHHGDQDEALDATAPAIKRRRPSAKEDEGDDKLQDFLQVMQPQSKSRAWENQDVLAGARNPPLNVDPKVQTLLAANKKSDRDYEPVPKKQKKSKNEHKISAGKALAEHVLTAVDSIDDAQAIEIAEVEGNISQSEPVTTAAATDDEWLRSRTSRLLGSIDDDETLAIRVPQRDQDEPKDMSDDKDGSEMEGEKPSDAAIEREDLAEDEDHADPEPASSETKEPTAGNGRLFLRNLTYASTENDIRKHFESNGFEGIEEIHLPVDFRSGNGHNKGFAHVQFTNHETATRVLQSLDQKPFQGRLLHILPSNSRKPEALDDFAISKLPLKQQQQIRRKAEVASSTFNWNSMYMSSDAVISSISDRLGVAKSELLDPTSSDAAVKQAHAETHIIQETKSYFMANGIDLDAFKKNIRGNTAILVKNFPFGTKRDELRSLFDTHGSLKQLLMPPSGTIAIVEFEQADHARSAFGSLSYSKFRGSILFLEKAPKDLFMTDKNKGQVDGGGSEVRQAKPSMTELLDEERPGSANTTTLFVRNLNFTTTDKRLREAFESLDGFMSARVKTKPDPKKKGETLSMGFGFLEFRSKQHAQAALAAMDGCKLEGHELLIRASKKAINAAEERRNEDEAKKIAGRKTKIIIKNLPFEASKKDVRSLFGAYGQLRSVRVPKKYDSSTRGFAFADFISAREAENAMDALRETHLLGRRLVLEFTAEEEMEPEAAIEQMQKKVGKQADKVALQKLTGTGRKKFNMEGADGDDQLAD